MHLIIKNIQLTCASGHIWPTTNPCEPPENLSSVNNATSCNIKRQY